VCEEIALFGGLGMHLIGMDCRVTDDFDEMSNNYDKKSTLREVEYIAWSLQSWFGQELAVKLVVKEVDKSVGKEGGECCLMCEMVFRCAEEKEMHAISDDVEDFVAVLTGGVCGHRII